MTAQPQRFDHVGALPRGTVVLEASAGTGKTYAIAALATRFVAERGIPLGELLLVTFTKAATAELRERVRRRLVEAADHLEAVMAGGPTTGGDELLRHLAAATSPERARRHQRLTTAITDFDTATISTIHGFCQQVLRGIGLAADVPREATLLEDETDLREQIVRDRMVAMFLDRTGAPSLRHVLAAAKAAVDDPEALVLPADDARADDVAGEDPEATGRLLAHLAREARTEIVRSKRAAGLLSHQDLLTRLRDAVRDPVVGDAAVAVLRSRYRIALVDEFQDTDPVQWDILDRAFAHGGEGRALVLIGDPKQAIYAFRGADVRAYLRATRDASRFTLATNWRSDAPVVRALDHLFAGTIYGLPEIVHRTVEHAPGHGVSRLTGSPGACAPLAVRLVTAEPGGTQAPSAEGARRHIARDVAAEVVRTLQDDAVRIDDRAARPQDIAVLVRTNREAAEIQGALREVRVPAVINGVGSVFATAAARQWLDLLDALQQPSSASAARRLAVTAFVGWGSAELADGEQAVWDTLHELLHTWAQVLATRGVAALLRAVSDNGHLAARTLGTVGGERHLTDIHHVGELLHATQHEDRLGAAALTDWLRERIEGASEASVPPDEQARRLESDAEAVQILTVHRSKGLEFGIVLCPSLWSGGRPAVAPLTYADPETDRRVVDVGPKGRTGYDHSADRWREEQRGEALRLLYVATTRARHRVVLWWAPTRGSDGSALAHVLFHRDDDGRVAADGVVEVPDRTETCAVLTPLLTACGGTVTDVPESIEVSPYTADVLDPDLLRTEKLTRHVDRTWRRTSYSRLIDHGGAPASARDLGARDRAVAELAEETSATDDEELVSRAGARPGGDVADDGRALREVALPLAEVRGSAELGTMVHAVLEHVDFAAPDLEADLAHHLDEQQARHLVARDARDVLLSGLLATIRTPLGAVTGDRPLTAFPRSHRLDEPRFEFPLAGGDLGRDRRPAALAGIADLFAAHVAPGDPLAAYHERLRDPRFDLDLRGYLNGAIDLVLRVPGGPHGDRYVVVDHKTNRLGWPDTPTAWHYRQAGLAAAMQDGHYPLQALMYAVALHRLLRWRLPGYAPDRHLGGVAYLFVRGMTGPDVPREDGRPCGVFSWTPPSALVTGLSDLLDGRARPMATR